MVSHFFRLRCKLAQRSVHVRLQQRKMITAFRDAERYGHNKGGGSRAQGGTFIASMCAAGRGGRDETGKSASFETKKRSKSLSSRMPCKERN